MTELTVLREKNLTVKIDQYGTIFNAFYFIAFRIETIPGSILSLSSCHYIHYIIFQ